MTEQTSTEQDYQEAHAKEQADKQLAQHLISRMSGKDEALQFARVLLEELQNNHRTIQQNVFRGLYQLISDYSKDGGRGSDARNDESMVFSKMVRLSDFFFPYV